MNGPGMKTTNPEEIRYCCPKCGETGFHLYYNIRKHVWHCFKCGARGKEEPEKMYTEEALEEVFRILSGKEEPEKAKKVLMLPHCKEPGDDAETRATIAYLKKRGFYKGIKRHGFLIPQGEQYEHRFLVPIYSPRGNRVTFFQTRGYFDFVRPKYLNPVYPKGASLFSNFGSRLMVSDHLFVTEGIFKALNLAKINQPAVAIFGKEITREQCRIIWEYTREATILLDPDAFTFAISMCDMMDVMKPKGSRLHMINPPKPPDNMTTDELRDMIDEWRTG